MLAGEIVDATVHERARPRRVPRRADGRRPGAGRAVLDPPQGHDDEGLRPDHLRPRGEDLLRRRVREARRHLRPHRREPQQRPRRRARARRRRCPTPSAPPIEAAIAARAGGRPAAGDGRLRPRHHQPARAERHHHRRVDAADDPRLRADVERGRRAAGHQGRHPRLVATPVCTPRSSTTARPTARSTRPRWARCPTSGSWRRRPRSTARTTRRSRSPSTAPCASSNRAGDAVLSARGRGGRHLAGVPGEGRRRSATGCGSRCSAGPRSPARTSVFWLDETRAHDAQLIAKVREYLPEHDTVGAHHRDPGARRGRARTRSSASAGARTPSRSPATCCATTSPTCSRSWSSAPAPRCSRSCR